MACSEKQKAANRKWYAKYRDRNQAVRRAWNKAHPEKMCEASKRHYWKHPLKILLNLIRRYGKGADKHYLERMDIQDGLCAICKQRMPKPHFDHNHKTGQWRDLLCFHCNAGLGHFNDDFALLGRAAEYLQKFAITSSCKANETASGITPQPFEENVGSRES